MGSTLSFPLLCILNLAAYWKSIDESEGVLHSFKDLKVMVNGDDILFRAISIESPLYQTWLRNIAIIGFVPSPGKNYVHERYLTVNSQAYDFNPATKELKPIGFLNVGLLVGQAKVSRREKQNLTPLQGKYDEVIRGATDKVRAHRRFIHYNRSSIEDLSYGGRFSLFIDPLLGGLGFTLHEQVARTINFTRFQKGFARFCLRRLKKGFTGKVCDIPEQYLGVITPRMRIKSQRPDPSWGTYHLKNRYHVLSPQETVLRPLSVDGGYLQGVNFFGKEVEDMEVSLKFPKLRTLRDFRI
jgi:hypothetical protein